MKKLCAILLFICIGQFANAQFLIGGSYKRFIPASDTAKYVYKTGGGLELQGGIALGKKSSIMLVVTGGIDILKINHQTNSDTKDGWLFITGGLRKDFVFGHAKKEGAGGDREKTFFLAGNYGASASNYTARVTSDAKKSLNTKVWNAGLGVHLAGFELAYFYQNMQDVKRKGWLPVHEFKIGISILGGGK